MKKNHLFLFFLIACCFFYSCKKDDIVSEKKTGTITFNYSAIENNLRKAQRTNPKDTSIAPIAIIVSIVDDSGVSVANMEEIPLYDMNGNYISKPLSLDLGNYRLTDFLVVDKEGNVLYLAPKEESALAYLVSDPLPVNFTVNKDEVTKVAVEVLKNDGGSPEDYGYSTFSFNVVDVFDLYVSVFTYNDEIQNFMLANSQLDITKDGSIILSKALSATTSIIPLRNEVGNYVLTISKNGYQTYISSLTLSDLQGYNKDNPLVVILQKAENNIITNGLIAYYPFSGNTKDAGSNQLDAVCNASLTTDRFGNENSAYHFNGSNQYIDFPNNSLLKPQFPFTISFWVKLEEWNYTNQLLTTDYAEDIYTGVFFGVTIYGNPSMSFGNGNYISINSRFGKKGTSVLQVGQWYYFTGVFNSNTDMQIYINGVNDGGTYEGYATNLVYSNQPGSIGRKDAGNSTQAPYYFKGSIDNVSLYSRALTENEIKTMMNLQ